MVQWNTTNTTSGGYGSSNIKKECESFSNTLGLNSLDYVIDTGTGKMFIPTLEQFEGESGGFSWFDSDDKRMAKWSGIGRSYWMATLQSSSYICIVGSDGSTNGGSIPSDGFVGFRPCIAIKT